MSWYDRQGIYISVKVFDQESKSVIQQDVIVESGPWADQNSFVSNRRKMDRWLLQGYTDEVLIPTALVRKWTAVIQSVLHMATEWEHKHGGPCHGNPACGFGRMGIDCPEPCLMPVCGNHLHKDGFKRIRVLRKPDQRKVFTREPVEKGTQVGEFSGIVMQTADYRKFARELREDKGAFLSGVDYMNGEHLVLVARKVGNWSQLIRHSCEPNLVQVCRMGDSRVPVLRLQALRRIEAGEPLTLDFAKELCNEGMDFEFDCIHHVLTRSGEEEGKEGEGVSNRQIAPQGSEVELQGEDLEMGIECEDEVSDTTDEEEGEVNEENADHVEKDKKVDAAEGVKQFKDNGMDTCGLNSANQGQAVVETSEVEFPVVKKGPDSEEVKVREREDGEITDDEDEGQLKEGTCSLAKRVLPEGDLEDGECSESDDGDGAMEVQVASTENFGGNGSTKKSIEVGVTVQSAREAIGERSAQEMPEDGIEGSGPAHKEVAPAISQQIVNVPRGGEKQCRQLEEKRKLAVSLRDIREGSGELRRFVCGKCHKGFVNQSKLKRHAMSHERGSFHCNVCGAFSSTKGGLQRHMYRHRDPESGAKAGVSSKRKTNGVDKRFTCGPCGRSYTRKSDLTRHLARHAIEKNFCCSECDKRFLQAVELDRHVSAIHTA